MAEKTEGLPADKARRPTANAIEGKLAYDTELLGRRIARPASLMPSGPGTRALRQAAALQLQRTIGNASTARQLAPSVQRLMSGAALLEKTDANNRILYRIAIYLIMYDKLPDPMNAAEINKKFRLLRLLDKQIYQWFDSVSATHDQLKDNPHTDTLTELLKETEAEYARLVDQYKDNVDVLPFDIGAMGVDEAKNLWRSVVNNDAKIKLVGSDQANMQILAMLAKILNTKTGKDLIRFLNTPSVDQPLADEMSNIYLGDTVKNLPKQILDASPEVKDGGESLAAPLGDDKDTRKLTQGAVAGGGVLSAGFEEVKSPAHFRAAVLGSKKAGAEGRKGIGFDSEGMKEYSFTKGTGSFVTVHGEEPSALGGPGNREILGPRFITLAHELGHAAHFKAGASAGGLEHTQFMEGMAPEGADADSVWDNSEEFNVISNWENPIRSESGIGTARTGHRDPKVIRAQELYKLPENKKKAADRFKEMGDRILPLVIRASKLGNKQAEKEIENLNQKHTKTYRTLYHVDEYYQELISEVDAHDKIMTDENVQRYQSSKKRFLLDKFYRLEKKRKLASSKLKRQTEDDWNSIVKIVKVDLDKWIAKGFNNEFNQLEKNIDELLDKFT